MLHSWPAVTSQILKVSVCLHPVHPAQRAPYLTFFWSVAGTGNGNMSMTPGNTATRNQTAGMGNSGSNANDAGGCRSCHPSRAHLLLLLGPGCADQHGRCCSNRMLHSWPTVLRQILDCLSASILFALLSAHLV